MSCCLLPSYKEQLLPTHYILCCTAGTVQFSIWYVTGSRRYEVDWAVFSHLKQAEGRGSGQAACKWITRSYKIILPNMLGMGYKWLIEPPFTTGNFPGFVLLVHKISCRHTMAKCNICCLLAYKI